MPKLILVPTPIGNLEDITLRAISVLNDCDFVIAEDTRTSGNLLRHLNIQKSLVSFHIHNEHKIVSGLVEKIKQSSNVVLVSDAGTPAISDPGYLLVSACISENILVECLPGSTALIPALVVSGFPTDRFVFEGFLPPKKGRTTRISSWLSENRTVVFYESPHKLRKTILQLIEVLGFEREICVVRELSKKFEEHVRGNLQQIKDHFEINEPRGEFVLVLKGVSKKERNSDE
jgi:16S rRNA (cytidine1402-2'-O)-methyltransferase